MSNRTLIIVLVAIILAAVVVIAGIRIFSNSSENSPADSYGNSSGANNTATNSNQSQTNSSPTNNPTTMNDCTRSFDEKKLADKITLANQTVTLQVKDFGAIKVQLYDKDAPKTVENFLRLTHSGFYDCLTFHRVAQGFVVQAGDLNGNGSGGMTAFGTSTFADELNPNAPSFRTGYVKGVLAMANRGPNTNSSQFFITLADVNNSLPKSYTIFGRVVEGMDIVDKIGAVEITPGPFGGADGAPVVPVVIEKATIN